MTYDDQLVGWVGKVGVYGRSVLGGVEGSEWGGWVGVGLVA